MRRAREEEREKILTYLEQDLGNCIYLYLDIMEYGVCGEHMTVWVNEGEIPGTVLMRYHDSLQVYAALPIQEEEALIELIEEQKVSMISGEKTVINTIVQKLPEGYKLTDGWVFEIADYRNFEYPKGFGIAEESDMEEIAELVCSDDNIGGHYQVHDLKNQFIERFRGGMGRNYYVRKNGNIISHIGTYAESDKIAVTGGMVTREDARKAGYGSILEGCLVNDLLKEGKRVFTFVNEARRARYLRIMGAIEYGQYAKLEKR